MGWDFADAVKRIALGISIAQSSISYIQLARVRLGRDKAVFQPEKHGLDFRDAHLVYNNPDKITYDASRSDEYRLMDAALLVPRGKLLTPVSMKIEDEVRVIAFRNASREERKAYEQDSARDNYGQ